MSDKNKQPIPKEEILEAMSVLTSLCDDNHPRAKVVLEYAKTHGLLEGEICAMDGSRHAAAKYALQLDWNSESIAEPTEEESESFQIVAILLALEKSRKTSICTPFSLLNYEINTQDLSYVQKDPATGVEETKKFFLTNSEIAALYAQTGGWKSNSLRQRQMRNSKLAVCLYCGDLFTQAVTLPGRDTLPAHSMPAELKKEYDACFGKDSPFEALESLLMTFGVAFVGKENEDKIISLLGWMRASDFMYAPASDSRNFARQHGLIEHTCNVIARHVALRNPRTKEELGEIVLAGVCHDLGEADSYSPYYTRKKVYVTGVDIKRGNLPAGHFREPDNRVYRLENALAFEKADRFAQLPIPHGARSVHMASRILGKVLPKHVAEAIDAHERNVDENPYVDWVYQNNQLALYLHMANILSIYLDEPKM